MYHQCLVGTESVANMPDHHDIEIVEASPICALVGTTAVAEQRENLLAPLLTIANSGDLVVKRDRDPPGPTEETPGVSQARQLVEAVQTRLDHCPSILRGACANPDLDRRDALTP